MKRLNIIVLAAGTSSERDVSIVTGSRVCAALRRMGHKAEMVDVFLGLPRQYRDINEIFNENTDISILEKTLKEATSEIPDMVRKRSVSGESFFGPQVLEACKAADIVFMGLHGANGEDGKIQAAFDLLGIKYTGTGYLSSAISMNKKFSKLVLRSAGVPMPMGIDLLMTREMRGSIEETYRHMTDTVASEVGFPCVVKPCCGGSSVGVSIVRDASSLGAAFDAAFALEDEILVEEYIAGREFSVGIINQRALPIIEIAPIEGFYDYKNKYVPGMTKDTCPAELPDEVSDRMKGYAELAAKAVELEAYGRVDFLLDKEGHIYCLEINTLPGMTDTSLVPQEAAAEGMGYDALCEELVKISMEKYHN